MAKSEKKILKDILIDDICKYKIPASLQYSPDGKLLAFHTTEPDIAKNTYKHNVYLIKDGICRQVTHSLDASFLFFDDNETLVLERSSQDQIPGTTQLFKLHVGGGEAEPWITLPFFARGYKKVSDGLYAVTGMISVKDPDGYKDDPETKKKKMEALAAEKDYQVVDEVPYWFNGAGFTNGLRPALFLVDTTDGLKIKRITGPEIRLGRVLPLGRKIYYTGSQFKCRAKITSKIWAYDLDKKKISSVFNKEGYSIGRLFELNGELYCEATDGKKFGIGETGNICKVGKNSLETVYVPETTLSASVIGDTVHGGGDDTFSDGKHFVTVATVDDHNAVYSFDEAFEKTVIWEEPGMVGFIAVSDDKIAMCYQDWDHVAEIYEMTRDGKDLKKVTCLDDALLTDRYIARPERIDYTSADEKLHGWVLLPKGFSKKKKYPAVLDIHGGPRASYGETFFHEMQLWAAQGYIVFFTNIRGSDGRGDAFADIRDQYGYVDYENIMDFTDAVLDAYPEIDKGKVCVTGGSYGGFMTNWIITHTDRFCCAASQRSISNWISMSFISDIGSFFGPDQCGADGLFGDENILKMWDHSPLRYADKVKTPTLFIHSDEDYRCPLPEGMQMMQALANRDVKTRLVIFKGENHELSRSGKPAHRIRRLKEITDWFHQFTD